MDGILMDYRAGTESESIEGVDKVYWDLPHYFDTYIIASPSWQDPQEWSERAAWIKCHFGDRLFNKLILGHHLNLSDGDILISRHPKTRYKSFKGEHIRYGSPSYPDWKTILIHLCGKPEGISFDRVPERSMSQYDWVPHTIRTDRYGNVIPHPNPETRKPIYRTEGGSTSLHFINDSDQTLEYVKSSTGGFKTFDDASVTVTDNNQYRFEYTDVLPGESVKVDTCDPQIDCDFVLCCYIEIKLPGSPPIEFSTTPEKGGFISEVLLWDTGEPGKNVNMKTL